MHIVGAATCRPRADDIRPYKPLYDRLRFSFLIIYSKSRLDGDGFFVFLCNISIFFRRNIAKKTKSDSGVKFFSNKITKSTCLLVGLLLE